MNRWDEIQGLARDIASNVHASPEARDAMADDLIRLCGLMIEAVGKVVAVEGESNMSDAHSATFEPDPESDEDPAAQRADFIHEQRDDAAKAHGMYITGERIQDGAREAVGGSVGADLERYAHGPYGKPVWQHTDRRPATLRRSGPVTVVVPCQVFPDGCPNQVTVPAADGHHGGVRCGCEPHTWVTALDGADQPARDEAGNGWQHCGVCGVLKPGPTLLMGQGDCQGPCCGGTGPVNYNH